MSGNRFNLLTLVVVMLAALGCARHPWVRVGVPGSRDITILIHSERVLDGGGTQYDSSIYVLQSGGQEFVYGLLGSHLNRLWMRASDGVFVWDYLVDGAELRRISEQVGDADIFGGQVAVGSFSANGMLVIESGRESYAISPFRSYNLEEQGLERACWYHSLGPDTVSNGKQLPQNWICYVGSPAWYAYSAVLCAGSTPLRALAAGRTLGSGNFFYNDCKWLWWNFGNGRAWYMESPLLPRFPDYLLEEVKP